jgi:hypothetical protein
VKNGKKSLILMQSTVDSAEMGFMLGVEVAVDFFFSVEDFSAFWTHVLACPRLRGASALKLLIHQIIHLCLK